MIPNSGQHPSEADLVLHFYGDPSTPASVDRHLSTCQGCAASYRSIVDTLTLLPENEAPARSEMYGLEVWQRIRPQLPGPRPAWWSLRLHWRPVGAVAFVFLLVAAAFVAGRYSPIAQPPSSQTTTASMPGLDPSGARLAATLDHLEETERVLLDLSNAEGLSIDVSLEQAWAADLVDSNRLFREAAVQAGDVTVATLLDDLERTLLDVVHAPSTLTPAELDNVRTRVDAAALLFKVRILTNELRERETAPTALDTPRKTT